MLGRKTDVTEKIGKKDFQNLTYKNTVTAHNKE